MRSHPYEPAPPFPPILTSLAALLPEPPQAHQSDTHSASNSVALSQLDHDTSRLVPEQKQRHHVWIQGKLTPVRSVSGSHLSLSAADGAGTVRTKKRETMRDLETPRRRRSMGDNEWPDDEDEDCKDNARGATRQNTQLRGYGIGGAGNIRRPTDVIHGPTKQNESFWALCFSSNDGGEESGKRRLWDVFNKKADRKGKARVETATS
ncbi:hypothetical protein LIA77_03662 [Sarocladium implicatum]|nr:hypothetical protein LIA77_03662 [Sarocladium implicatum]